MIPWVRNRDTTFATCEFTRLMPDPTRILHAWICNSPGPSGWCWSCTHHAWCDPGSLPRADCHRLPVDRTSHCNHTENKRWLTTSCVSYGGVPVYRAVLMRLASTAAIHRWSVESDWHICSGPFCKFHRYVPSLTPGAGLEVEHIS